MKNFSLFTKVFVILTIFCSIAPRDAEAIETSLTKSIVLNGVTFNTVNLDKPLLEQYMTATSKIRTLNLEQFKVTVTQNNKTTTFTSLKELQSYLLGKDKGLSFIQNTPSSVVKANDAAKWTIKDEFFSDQFKTYDNMKTMITDDLFRQYAESLLVEKYDVEMLMTQSVEESMQHVEEMYQEIFAYASNQYGGVGWLIMTLLGCPDAGGTGCWMDDDCDGVHNSADSHPNDSNRQTDWNNDGENSITAESEGGVWGTYLQSLGVTNTNFLNLVEIYDTHQTELLSNMTALQTKLTQVLQQH